MYISSGHWPVSLEMAFIGICFIDHHRCFRTQDSHGVHIDTTHEVLRCVFMSGCTLVEPPLAMPGTRCSCQTPIYSFYCVIDCVPWRGVSLMRAWSVSECGLLSTLSRSPDYNVRTQRAAGNTRSVTLLRGDVKLTSRDTTVWLAARSWRSSLQCQDGHWGRIPFDANH